MLGAKQINAPISPNVTMPTTIQRRRFFTVGCEFRSCMSDGRSLCCVGWFVLVDMEYLLDDLTGAVF